MVNPLKNKSQTLLVAEWGGAALLFGVFLIASVHKLGDAEGFSKIIAGYRLLPAALVGWVVLFLPWLEINMALAILIPKARNAALLMAVGLLAVFAALTGWNLLQGNEVPCGCFSNDGGPATWWSVLRNVALAMVALMTIYIRILRVGIGRRE
jgi:hypothetical protein